MSLIILILTCFTLLIITIYQSKRIKLMQKIYLDTLYKFMQVEELHENMIELKDLRINNLIKINQSTNAIKNNKLKTTERDHKKLKVWVNNIKLPH